MRLEERMEHGHEAMAIGSTMVGESGYILDGRDQEEMIDKISLDGEDLIQFPPKMDENWLRYELLN